MFSLDDKSQYYKISGAQSSRYKMARQPAGFRCLPASIDKPVAIEEFNNKGAW